MRETGAGSESAQTARSRKTSRHLPLRFVQMLRSNLAVARWYERDFGESTSFMSCVRVAWMDARKWTPPAEAEPPLSGASGER